MHSSSQSSFDNIDTVDMEMSDEEQDCGSGKIAWSSLLRSTIIQLSDYFPGASMNDNGNGGSGQFRNFPPQAQGQWAPNNGMQDSPGPNGNHGGGPWNKAPQPGGFFPGGPNPMVPPGPGPMNSNFGNRGGGFNRGGGGPGGNGMFRGRGSPFRGNGNFRGGRGGGRGMW